MPASERPRTYSSDLSTSSPNFFRVPTFDQEPFTPTENVSSLDSDELNNASLHFPQPTVQYEPITIPREPTLEEILDQAAGGTNLLQVTQLKIRVVSERLSLQQIALYCPMLTSLNLEGSTLVTLRELGCMMINLKKLDVSRCGLTNLDGTTGLGSVTHLTADSNQIAYLEPCSFLDNLEELSVQGNVIRSTNNLRFLSVCPKLRTLYINGNPIEEENENFQDLAFNLIPHLIFLNGVRIREEEGDMCNDNSLNSLNTRSSDSSGSSFNIWEIPQENVVTSVSSDQIREATSQPQDSQSTTTNARENQRPLSAQLLRLNELRCKLSTGRCASSGSESNVVDKKFPERLPQTLVDLESGVIAPTMRRSPNGAVSAEIDNVDNVFLLVEKWRYQFQKLRQANERRKSRESQAAAISPNVDDRVGRTK